MRMMRVRQLQGDVNEREEAELRRLEGGLQVGGDDAVDEAVLAAPPVKISCHCAYIWVFLSYYYFLATDILWHLTPLHTQNAPRAKPLWCR